MVDTHPLILSLRSAGLKDIDPCNIGDVHSMWHAFSKAKHCIDGGDRFEYISWRIYSREVLLNSRAASASGHFPKADEAPLKVSDQDTENESASESEWESDSADSLSDEEVPQPTKAFNSEKNLSSIAKDGTHNDPNDTNNGSHPHRKISSLELQNLFDDSQKPINHIAFDDTEKQKPINTANKPSKSCLKKSSSSSPVQHHPVFHARFASPQPDYSSGSYRPSTRSLNEGATPSSVVRGFSPSNVSVSVSSFKQDNNKTFLNELDNIKNDETNTAPANSGESSGEKTPSSSTSRSSPSNRSESDMQVIKGSRTKAKDPLSKKMFYICAADSDTESSNMGSPDVLSRVKSSSDAKRHNSTKLADEVRNEDNDDIDDDNVDSEEEMKSNDGSDWDDISDSEEGEPEAESEERRKDMFRERAVPTKPLLKRSLLSSLFVNQVKDSSPVASDNSSQHTKESTGSPVSAPVDIILGAHLAPHFPLPVEQFSNNIDSKHWSGTNNIIGGGIMGQREQEQQQQAVTRSLEENNTQNFMTSRPEMTRASTDSRIGSSVTPDTTFQNSWVNQHEDIYDPMNYHSRGW